MASAKGYADRLSPYDNKGTLNLQDSPDCALALLHKARFLAERMKEMKHVVVHTGAGISTSAGISDFRGPNGIWTQESRPPKRVKMTPRAPTVSFEDAMPTLTHVALAKLYRAGHVHYIVSQNVDGLHVRGGLPREALSELHGNLFVDWCAKCQVEFARQSESRTVGYQLTGRKCPNCGGDITDKALDWENKLPEPDFSRAKEHSARADLHLVAGTSCQMEPARGLPFRGTASKHARFLVNLSKTDFDERFGTVIRAECDTVFAIIVTVLNIALPCAKRVSTLAFQAARVGTNICCEMRVRWDGAWVSRRATGIHGVRYRPVTDSAWGAVSTQPGYQSTIPDCEDIEAEVLLEDPIDHFCDNIIAHFSLGESLDHSKTKVITRMLRHNEDGENLVRGLQWKVSEQLSKTISLKSLNEDEFFISAKRRGWTQCVICDAELWSRKVKRDQHLAECLQNVRLQDRWRLLDM